MHSTFNQNGQTPKWVHRVPQDGPPPDLPPEEFRPHPAKHFELKETIHPDEAEDLSGDYVQPPQHHLHIDQGETPEEKLQEEIEQQIEAKTAPGFRGDWLGTPLGRIFQVLFTVGLVGGSIWGGIELWSRSPALVIVGGIFVLLIVMVAWSGWIWGESSIFNMPVRGGFWYPWI